MRTIQIFDITNITQVGVEYSIQVRDKLTGAILSQCRTGFDSDIDTYAAYEEDIKAGRKHKEVLYKEFRAETEEDVIEKQLKYVDFETLE